MVYTSMDIGSDAIKIVVVNTDKDNTYNVLGSVNVRTIGVKKGVVVDKSMLAKSINLAIDEINKKVGFKIDKVLLTLSAYDCDVNMYNGILYTDGVVRGQDVVRCFGNTIKDNISKDRVVTTVFPIDFIVDDEDKYLDPKGVNGYKLESRMLISTLPKDYVYPYLEVLNERHIEVVDLSLNLVNDYYQAARDEFKTEVGAVIDIGDAKTEVGVFNKGLLVKSDVIPMGSRLIDNDIKYIYGFDKTTLRILKEEFALATSNFADQEEIMEYESLDGEKKQINQLEISQIVEARLEEILKNVKKCLKTLTNRETCYIIITGGVSDMPGFNYLIEKIFGDIVYTINMNNLGVRSNIYCSAFGSIKYYCDKMKIRDIDYNMYDNVSANDDESYETMLEMMQDFISTN